jgi:hypothetical protein
MQFFQAARRKVLTTLLSLSLAALQVVSRKLALSAEERRTLAERVGTTLMTG